MVQTFELIQLDIVTEKSWFMQQVAKTLWWWKSNLVNLLNMAYSLAIVCVKH